MELTVENREGLHDALVDALDGEDDLERLLRHGMDVRLWVAVPRGSLDEVVFDLLAWLEAQGRIDEFVRLLRRRRPHHAALRAALDRIEGVLTPAPSPISPSGWLGDRARRWAERLRWWMGKVPRAAALALAAAAVAGVALLGWQRGWLTNDTSVRGEDSEPPSHAPAVWEKAFRVKGRIDAYVSPDNTNAVIKERIEAARESVLIGVYDFSAQHVKDMLLAAMQRGVRVSLLIDRAFAGGEEEVIRELTERGAEVTKFRSGRSAPFRTYHLKVIVIDRTWTLVQSANLTKNGVPLGTAGNREAGVAVESRELAEYFAGLLERDTVLARQMPEGSGESSRPESEPTYTAYRPVPRFTPLRIGGEGPENGETAGEARPDAPPDGLRILPVLSPENYMEVMPQILASARESVELEMQYILANREHVRKLMDAVKSARDQNPGLAVRIVLAQPFARDDRTIKELRAVIDSYGWKFDDHVRLLSRSSGMHCGNKMIIVDGRVCLVGSANWSDPGVTRNREANLLIDSRKVAGFYRGVFQADWDAGEVYTEPPPEEEEDGGSLSPDDNN